MKLINHEIEDELQNTGVDLVRFLDVSELADAQNRSLPTVILIGIAISPKFVQEIFDNPDYMPTHGDAYIQTEKKTGEVTDALARFLTDKGHKAISQSDAGLIADMAFNFDKKESVLPHKTVAVLGGLGWIGKNNLLITPEYGAAQCLGTLLTDAPLETSTPERLLSKCGNCRICTDICEKKVLKGKVWDTTVSRDEIIDVHGCSICLKCLVHCPQTQAYIKRNQDLLTTIE